MPGIVGIVTKMPRDRAEVELMRMVKSLCHHASYESVTWIDESLGLYLGWVERKDSFSSGMPLRNEQGDRVLVFSGEEFPEPGTGRHLVARGHTFNIEGPTYLVHLSEEDPAFPASLNGRFHGFLANQTTGRAMLFNDRYGMHRIYYHESKEAFYFAAEAKALLAVRPELRKADARGLGEFVACGCVLENRTLFEKVYLLPPAAAWIFQNGSLKRRDTYFEPQEWEDQTPLEPEPYYQALREVFSRTLPRYFSGQQVIGCSVTGGLDTRMILAWHKALPKSLPCYTFGGMYRDCRDVTVGRQVAQLYGQPHEVIPVGNQFLSNFSQYAERSVYLTDGCIDVSHSADLYVNERAHEIAPVRMTGNYGGEVLRQVRAFKPVAPCTGLFRPEFLFQVKRASETYCRLLRGHPLSFAVFRQAPWYHYGLLALEQTQLSLRSPFLDNDFVKTVFRAPQSTFTNNDISLRLIADGNAALRRLQTDRGFGGSTASQKFQEFTLKAEYAYDYGMPQSLARIDHLFSPFHLERLFLGRHKFYHFRVWYRDGLAQYVREMLLDQLTLSRPYFHRNRLEAIVSRHFKGDRNYTLTIHKVLTLELVHRLFLDSQ
jgi:asparagine synthase (glutamine-hydrolysing)